MSADLSKSKLASKDKDELTQIAQAMGAKPASRARKADIIDLIMELATGGDDSSSASKRDNSGSASQDSDNDADGDAPAAEAAPVYSADPMADVRAAEAREKGGDSGPGRKRRANRNGGADKQSSSSSDEPSPAKDTADSPAPPNKNNGESDDGGDQRNAGGDEGDQDPVEPGNRRRRRRGRGRDRAEQGEDLHAEPVPVEGVLDLRDDGYGFLRVNGFLPTREDVYVSVKQVRQFGLRKGDQLTGMGRPANRSEKNPAMVSITAVNGHAASEDADDSAERRNFAELTPVLPTERLGLEREDDPANKLPRMVDLLAPIGKGQRALIVSPAGTRATESLRSIAGAVETNHPDVRLIVVLIDEKPEEITEMGRLVLNGDVVTSSFEQAPDEHAAVVDLALERAKRLVEAGEDVVVIFDGIDRLARANNLAAAGNGNVSSQAISAAAMHPAKRFFGAARNVEEGGSLTIVASIGVDAGSAIDGFVFDEFSGTANMELFLDADAAAQRLDPPIDTLRSGTSNEDQLLEPDEVASTAALRKAIAAAGGERRSVLASLEWLIGRIDATDTNADLIKELA